MSLSDSTKRFSNRVSNYVKYRPHYPFEIIDFLKNETGLDKSSIIADIGSGTGISSEMFLENGNTVYAVEPNFEMRSAAEKIMKDFGGFISIEGTAENTSLGSQSVDLIIAGQAFHWFDIEKCRPEFKRILKNNGYAVLMWNDKTESDDFMKGYFNLIKKYGTDYEKINHANVDDTVIGKFFSPSEFKKKFFKHSHNLDYKGLEGRLLSSSYIPLEGESYNEMINELKEMFDKYSIKGEIAMQYETVIYFGKM